MGRGKGAVCWAQGGGRACEWAPGAVFPLGTYSLRCYDCQTINDFTCPTLRTCVYEVRRCLIVSVRKCLRVCSAAFG